jgi:RNA-directed DNA polymerase
MKTYKNLYPQICSFENLYLAFKEARRGKRRRPDVAAFENNLDQELLRLQDALQAQRFKPGPYRHFTVYEGKPRHISAAPFRDRVVHHALCNILEPIWELRFIHDSYACRRGKGTHSALDRCTYFARRYAYVLQCDIVQFFPSMDHQVLYDILARHIADPPSLALCRQIIDSGEGIHNDVYRMQWFPGDDLLACVRPRGLPIGNQTSQFWANVYLHELDDFVKRELSSRGYLRYCDDFLLFANDKSTLHHWRRAIEQRLARIRLKIHNRKTAIYPVSNGIPFLGFRVFPEHRRLARSNGLRFQRRWRRLLEARGAGRVDSRALRTRLKAWIAHASHGDTWGLRRSLLSTPTRPFPNSVETHETIPPLHQDP